MGTDHRGVEVWVMDPVLDAHRRKSKEEGIGRGKYVGAGEMRRIRLAFIWSGMGEARFFTEE